MSTVSVANVNQAAKTLHARLAELGMVPQGATVIVNRGSQSLGNSWGLQYTSGTGYSRMPAVDLHGAYSRSQAYERITAATYALDAVLWHQREQSRPQAVGHHSASN